MAVIFLSVVLGISVAVIVELSKVQQFLENMENSRWQSFYIVKLKIYDFFGFSKTNIADFKIGFFWP